MSPMHLADASKDELILTMLAVLGGDEREVNERDLFLASWHAFPNTMRWVDTALPNPDTFTASLRRLDQRGYIARVGKQERQKGRSRRRRTLIDPGRSGVVKARITEGGLDKAGIEPKLIEEVRDLVPDSAATRDIPEAVLVALCVALREDEGRPMDEGALVELAFHKFPDRFAYPERPEFPDVGRIRAAVSMAEEQGLMDGRYQLTDTGRATAAEQQDKLQLRADVSEGHKAGDLKFADRIEQGVAYRSYVENGTLAASKPDELFRALRIAPTTNPHRVAKALTMRTRALRRIDKGQIAEYLVAVARKHNPEVADLAESTEDEAAAEAPAQTGGSTT